MSGGVGNCAGGGGSGGGGGDGSSVVASIASAFRILIHKKGALDDAIVRQQFRRGPPTRTTPFQRMAPLPRSTQVLSTRSLGLLNFASEVGLSQHTG